MNMYTTNNVSYNKEQNGYFKDYFKSHVKDKLKEVDSLPTDIKNYLLDTFHVPYFSIVEIGPDQVDNITSIPEHVIGVYLYGKITHIPEYILNNKNIKIFDCSYSHIEVLPKHNFFKQLVYLNCSFTKISELPNNLDNIIVIDAKYTMVNSLYFIKIDRMTLKYVDLFNCKAFHLLKEQEEIKNFFKHIKFVF